MKAEIFLYEELNQEGLSDLIVNFVKLITTSSV